MDNSKTVKEQLIKDFKIVFPWRIYTGDLYKLTGEVIFLSDKGVPFHIDTMGEDKVLIEYLDNMEDGDLYYISEQSYEEIKAEMTDEIKNGGEFDDCFNGFTKAFVEIFN